MSYCDYLAKKIKFIENFIIERLDPSFPRNVFNSNDYSNDPSITIKRETYEDLFRFIDSREKYKDMSFNDFLHKVLNLGLCSLEHLENHINSKDK